MKSIILYWLENQRMKYEKLFCKHDFKKIDTWNVTDRVSGAKQESTINLFMCSKCGEFKKINIMD